MRKPSDKYWFGAKTHGWGFAAPTCWQGWVVLVVYVVLIVAGCVAISLVYAGRIAPLIFSLGIFVGVVSLLFFMVCVCKGPRLRWRNNESDTGDYPPGCCQRCGYDLTGNLSGICPECGSRLQDEGAAQ